MIAPSQHIHIIGIGGAGMSAIARVLIQKGVRVSGSDRSASDLTQALAAEGVRIFIGHAAEQVDGADLVLMSSAVRPDHVEVQAAHERGIPVCKRSDVMADLMAGQTAVAIAGTHGKTTTTSMTAHILLRCGQDPSYIVGGVLRSTGVNAAYGRGRSFVIEADEYDHMFLGLRPQVAVITNVEWDHPDFFPTPAAMSAAFARFAALVPADGRLIVCADDDGARKLGEARAADGIPVTRYGIDHPDADWRAVDIRIGATQTRFAVTGFGSTLGEVVLNVPGRHNVLNALAALIAASTQGMLFQQAAAALGTFEGAGRRFELRGENNGVVVIDDYAHHPTAIRATLAAARGRYPGCTIWAVWQPHTYSRTQMLLDDFAGAFADADHVLVTDIYAAREQPVPGLDAARVAASIDHGSVRAVPTSDDAVACLLAEVSAPAVIVIMSAGDAPQIGIEYLARKRAVEISS